MSDADSDIEVLEEKICNYGGNNSTLSNKRKKSSSKKKKKEKSKRYKSNFDGSPIVVKIDSDSESDIELQENIASREKVSDDKNFNSSKKSCIKDPHSSSSKTNCVKELSSSGVNIECESNFDENKTTAVINKTTEISSKKQNTDNEDLEKYVGNISNIDFNDMEMDTDVSQKSSILTDSQKTVSIPIESQTEKNDSRKNFCIFNKFWKAHFDVEDGCSSQITQIPNTVSKKMEVGKNNSAKLDGSDCEPLMKNVGSVNKDTSKQSMTQTKNLPMTIDANGNRIFRFFWLDAYETIKSPGIVHLFGKVQEKTNDFKSCCVAVKNIPRRIYVLPRKFIQRTGSEGNELNSFENVYNELSKYLKKFNVNEFQCKEVKKMYSFDKKDVPRYASYYEVRYSASYPAIDPNYSSAVIQAVFETSMSPLELFLIERNIKGPCWLDLKYYKSEPNKFSWCEIEVNCIKMEDISVTRYKNKSALIPPVVLAVLYIQVSMDLQSHKKEIINITILLNHKFQLDTSTPKSSFDQIYCFVTHPQKIDWPSKVEKILSTSKQRQVIQCKDELQLLKQFLDKLEETNPDMLVSYDSKFQLEVLVHQITSLHVKDWSRIGKLKCHQPPRFKGRIYLDQLFCGRPVCDIQTSIKELQLKITNNDLASLCLDILHKDVKICNTINPEDCPRYYESVEKLESLVRSTVIKAKYMLDIALEVNVLPLAVQQTIIAGNTLSRTLAAGISERNEYLLLHAFHANNYVIPEKRKGKEDPNKNYSGGTTLEPVSGFYDSLVLVMDFNSLYPSIIIEFNICFTTIPGAGYEDDINLCEPDVSLSPGILPIQMKSLIDGRNEVKKLLRSQLSKEKKFQCNIRQLAYKLAANSIYGCLGAPYSRFYAKGLAALITMKGRGIFEKAVYEAKTMGYEVIYGDTDSIMINTKVDNYEAAIAKGKYIKQCINKPYKKIQLDIDAVFKFLLLLKKKQYAGMLVTKLPDGTLNYTKEIKGLEIIKRNYCSLASDTGNKVLDQLLCDQPSEQRAKKILEILRDSSKILREGTAPLASLEILKQLSKDPSKYQTSQVFPHAFVAQRLNKNSGRKWQAGDIVPYVICKDGTDRKTGERAYHVTEMTANSSLKIDVDYYLLYQIYPVVLKICDPIQGINGQLIAEALGVKQSTSMNEQKNNNPLPIKKDRFADCMPFEFFCQNKNCKSLNQVKTVLIELPAGFQPSLAVCSNSICDLPPFEYAHYIQNKLQLDIRKFITHYYRSELKCDNQLCSKVCRSVALNSNAKFICDSCFVGSLRKLYKECDLYNQLCFFLHIFTLKENHFEKLNQKPSNELLDFYNKIREFIMDEIDNSAYNVVDLTKIFNPNVKETISNSKFDEEHLSKFINFID